MVLRYPFWVEANKVLDRTKETLHRLYHEDGKTLIELGALYQRSPGTVWGWFKKHGISTRSVKEAAERKDRAVSKKEIAKMRGLYNQGLSSNDIGKQLGRDGRLIRAHLEGELRERAEAVRLAVDNGKIRSPDVQVEDDFFAVLTPESVWVLGLIYGDGHIQNVSKTSTYRMWLVGSEEVCRKVADLIGHERGPVPHNQGSDCWVLLWSSRRMVQFLSENYGIAGKKSRRLRLPELPEDLTPHFLRGLWDADGHWERRKVTHRARTVLTSASEGMITDLVVLFESKGWEPKTWSGDVVLKGKKYRQNQIRLNVGCTRKFGDWLYKDSIFEIECSRKSLIIRHSYGA